MPVNQCIIRLMSQGGKDVIPVGLVAQVNGREIMLDVEQVGAHGAADEQRNHEAEKQCPWGESDEDGPQCKMDQDGGEAECRKVGDDGFHRSYQRISLSNLRSD